MLIALTATGLSGNNRAAAIEMVARRVEQASQTQKNRPNWKGALDTVPLEQRKGMAFLVVCPGFDVAQGRIPLINTDLAYRARNVLGKKFRRNLPQRSPALRQS
jgi:hypothetical protein